MRHYFAARFAQLLDSNQLAGNPLTEEKLGRFLRRTCQ